MAESSSIIFQCRSITGASARSRGQAKPMATRKAPVQRHQASVTGGTCPARPRAEHDIAGPEQVGRNQKAPGGVPE